MHKPKIGDFNNQSSITLRVIIEGINNEQFEIVLTTDKISYDGN